MIWGMRSRGWGAVASLVEPVACSIDAMDLATKLTVPTQSLIDAMRLSGRVGIVGAHDDSRVIR